MELVNLLFLLVGLVTGALLGWLVSRAKASGQNKGTEDVAIALKVAEEQGKKLKEQLLETNDSLKHEREQVIHLNKQNASLIANHDNLKQRLAEQKGELQELQDQFSVHFKNLANEILEEKSKKFTDQNKTNLGELLNPLKERIVSFEKKIEQNSKESIAQNASLKTQLEQLKDLNRQVTREAESLTKALKGESKTQGTWGEMQLEAILTKVGLEKDIHYFREQNFKNEEGKNQRLDYVIKLPEEKCLVLDSKVSLTAYSNYFDSEDENEREKLLKQHMQSVYAHIKVLGEKNYQNLYEIQQPDFILMFMANEPALTIALKEDPGLFEKALDKNIVLVSTSTLLATLRTVSYIWKQELQNRNAVDIARQAGALYDKFVGFSEDLVKVGNNLKTTQDNYENAMKKLTTGTGNLVRKTEQLKELGAKATKQLDQRLLDRSE